MGGSCVSRTPNRAPSARISVTSADEFAQKVEAQGGQVVVPKRAIPESDGAPIAPIPRETFWDFTSAIPRPNRAGPLPQGRRGALRAHLGDHSQQGGGPVGPGDIAVRLNLWPLTVKANNVDNFGGWMVLPDQANYLTRDAGEHMMAD